VWNNAAFRASRAAIASRSGSGSDRASGADGGTPSTPGPAIVCVQCRAGRPPAAWSPDEAADLVRGAGVD
jgi:hypothetical protein